MINYRSASVMYKYMCVPVSVCGVCVWVCVCVSVCVCVRVPVSLCVFLRGLTCLFSLNSNGKHLRLNNFVFIAILYNYCCSSSHLVGANFKTNVGIFLKHISLWQMLQIFLPP
jgi:hypothetical protein